MLNFHKRGLRSSQVAFAKNRNQPLNKEKFDAQVTCRYDSFDFDPKINIHKAT